MALETKSKQIGRYTYRVTQLPTSKGRRMLCLLTKAIGPVLGKLADGGGKSIGIAFEELSERINEADLKELCEVFGESSEVELPDGRRPRLMPEFQEMHFAGQFGELFEWLRFCVEVNYSDFFALAMRGVSAAGSDQAAASA